MKKILLKNGKALWVLSLLVILQSCYPNNDSIPISDLDTQSTFYNTDDLATAPTSAALVWEVVQLKGGDDKDLPYDGEVDDQILNTTLLELIALYGEENVRIISETAIAVPTPVNANIPVLVPSVDPVPSTDALFAPSIVLRNKDITIVYPGYPWWGGGWWGGYPGYPGGCYYCGYPPVVGTASYEVGSVVLDMYDIRQLIPGEPIPGDFDPSWVAIVRGLVGSNGVHNGDRVVSGIQRVFAQSPYLN